MQTQLVPLFDEVRALTIQATEQTINKQDQQFGETTGKIKELMEKGEVPHPGIRHEFEREITKELSDRVWQTLKFKSKNPTHFVSVIEKCWLISDVGASFDRGAVKKKAGEIIETVLIDEKRLTVLFIETTQGKNFLVTNEVFERDSKWFLKGVYVYDWSKSKKDFENEMEDMVSKIINWAKNQFE